MDARDKNDLMNAKIIAECKRRGLEGETIDMIAQGAWDAANPDDVLRDVQGFVEHELEVL